MTEDEAKTKWCPFTRLLTHVSAQDGQGRYYEGGYSYNRSPDDGEGYTPPSTFCIASACMAWREVCPRPSDRTKTQGYCGLAGAPP